METIHIARNGQPLGTFSEDQLREGIVSGQFAATDLYWIEGATDWRSLSELASQWGVEIPLPPALPVFSIPSDGTEPAWEHRKEIGFFTALFETIRGVLSMPGKTFFNLKQTGGFLEPLIYSIVAALFAQIGGIPFNLGSYNNNPAMAKMHQYLPGAGFDLTLLGGYYNLIATPGSDQPVSRRRDHSSDADDLGRSKDPF